MRNYEYIGKICPYCKTAFRAEDDIVLCSQCDMPHHKDCWVENQGCTTFGCLGTIKAADNTATTVTAETLQYEDAADAAVFCTRCGHKNEATSAFCPRCGNPLRAAQSVAPSPTHTEWQAEPELPMEAEIEALVGVNAEYYMPRFETMYAQTSPVSWNTAAFLVAPFWLLYRKMYGYAAAFWGAACLLTVANSWFTIFMNIGLYVAAGLFANKIYMLRLEKLARESQGMMEPYKGMFLCKRGGVNVAATVIAIVVYVLLVFLGAW